MELNREMFEPVIEEVIAINDLETKVILSFLMEKGRRQIQTCPRDIYKIVNMLQDYARMLEVAVEQWGLVGFHRATYEFHAETLPRSMLRELGTTMRRPWRSAGRSWGNGSGMMVLGRMPWFWRCGSGRQRAGELAVESYVRLLIPMSYARCRH